MKVFDIKYYKHTNKSPRKNIYKKRLIKNKLIAWEHGKEHYDGKRVNGYGGYKYDGRWKTLLPRIIKRYKLNKNSKVLDLGCKKGFFISDLKKMVKGITVYGIEDHPYPITKSQKSVKKYIKMSPYTKIPFKNNYFDFVFSLSTIYKLNLGDVVKCLREINRVKKKKSGSFISLGSFNNKLEKEIFNSWTCTGTTVLSKKDWQTVLKYSKYKGDYFLTNASILNL